MKIHVYDGRKLMRRSDGLFHDHFEGQHVEIEEIDEFLQELEDREWDYEDLTELLEKESESDEFVLNQEGDKNDAVVISLKSDLTIKV
ncbi:hypothetical protein Tco_1304702 [Tanacetum coccineum]